MGKLLKFMREKQRKNKRKNGKKSGNSSSIKTRQRRQVAVATHTQGTLKRIQAGRKEGGGAEAGRGAADGVVTC